MAKYSVGVDFGTLSARALVAEVETGRELASASMDYALGVMDDSMWDGQRLMPDWALQDPQDYLECLRVVIREALAQSGVAPEALPALLGSASHYAGLHVRGLMCVPPVLAEGGDNRRYFAEMRQLFIDNGNKKCDNISMDFLSMGMTDDYIDAVAEGANMVRVGTGIFGLRPYMITEAN